MYSYRPHDWLVGGRHQSPVQMFFGGLNAVTQGNAPAKAMARYQAEAVAQSSRVMQAYIDMTSQAVQSRTPQEFYSAQNTFMQTAITEQLNFTSRMLEAWSQMLVPLAGPVSMRPALTEWDAAVRARSQRVEKTVEPRSTTARKVRETAEAA